MVWGLGYPPALRTLNLDVLRVGEATELSRSPLQPAFNDLRRFSKEGPFWVSFYKAAVLYWGSNKAP